MFDCKAGGNTPLHWATRNAETVRARLAEGADVNAKNKVCQRGGAMGRG